MEVLPGVCIYNWLICMFLVLFGVYIYLTWRFGELKALGIPHDKVLPLLGTAASTKDLLNIDIDKMKKYGKIKIWGGYLGRDPEITIADPDILKQILVKDFNKFVNRRKTYMNGIFDHGMFSAKGDTWKHIRSLVTPAFTSGKLKQMTKQINDCSRSLLDNLAKSAQNNEAFEAKKYSAAFTIDVIASIAFGLKLDTQKDPDNEFNQRAKKAFDFDNLVFNPLLIISVLIKPLGWLFDRLGFLVSDKKTIQFFTNILEQTLEQRREQNMTQNDFIQLLTDAEKDFMNDKDIQKELKKSGLELLEDRKGSGLTHEEIMAQCLVFLLAGFDTTATTLSFFMYNMATHPEAQERAAQEVSEVMATTADMSYEDINKLKYLDMCLEESLRLFPAIIRVDRTAEVDVQYNGVKIPKGYVVNIPIKAMHMNPDVWPEPEIYDPERFSPDAKAARNPYNYLPFGIGPRNCVAMRLANMEIKIVMALMLKNFRLICCDKTQVPLEMKNNFFHVPKVGVWLKVEPR